MMSLLATFNSARYFRFAVTDGMGFPQATETEFFPLTKLIFWLQPLSVI